MKETIKRHLTERIIKSKVSTFFGFSIIGLSILGIVKNVIEPIDLTYILPLAIYLLGMKDSNFSNNGDQNKPE